jgi:hypothetical protein
MCDVGDRAWIRSLLLWGAVILMVALLTLAVYLVLIRPRGKAFDFFTIWFGMRRVWQRQNPYGLETARAIQHEMFGGYVPPGANQQGFVYPLYITCVLWPFVLLPFSLAVTIWCTMQLCALMAFLYVAAGAFHWVPSKGELVAFALAVLLVFRYPTNAFILGQTTIFVLFCTVLGLYWLDRRRDVLAGVAFALTLIKPNLSLMLVAAVLTWGIAARRLRVVAGTGGTLAVLLGLSFAWQPNWFGWLISGVQAYAAYSNVRWPFQQASKPWIGGVVLAVIVGLCVIAVVQAVRMWTRRHTLLAFCFVVILSLVVLPQTGSYSLTLLLIPAVAYVALDPRDRLVRTSVLISLTSPWMYWWLAMQRGIWVDQIALPLQFALIGAWVLFTQRIAYMRVPDHG